MPGDIHIDRMSFGYTTGPVFDALTLHFAARTATAIAGPNGSGKSTLLELIAGCLRPQGGSIEVPSGADIALAVQRSRVSDSLPITVAEAVAMGRWRRLGLWRRPSQADRDVVDYWISELELNDIRRSRLGDLSGGQRQRVLLAQMFAQEASVLLVDEPTVGLDCESSGRIAFHLRRLAAARCTVVVATHDVELAGQLDACVLLEGGRVKEAT